MPFFNSSLYLWLAAGSMALVISLSTKAREAYSIIASTARSMISEIDASASPSDSLWNHSGLD